MRRGNRHGFPRDDDDNPILRASVLKALGVWRAHLVSIITAGKKRKEKSRLLEGD